MKTNYKKLAKRYELAQMHLLERLPSYKRVAITSFLKNGTETRFMDEFVIEIARLAESDEEILLTAPESQENDKKELTSSAVSTTI